MADNKKDLTRIEDLSEFIHELEEDEKTSFIDLNSLEENESTQVTSFDPSSLESEDTESESAESAGESTTVFNRDELFSSSEEAPVDDNLFQEVNEFNSDNVFSTEDSPITDTEEDVSFKESEPTDFDSDFTSSLEFNKEPTQAPSISEDIKPSQTETIAPIDLDAPLPSAESFLQVRVPEIKLPENFEDLKKFAESTSFSGTEMEGNPSFSVLIKHVRFVEDVNDIMNLLKEFKLVGDSEEQIKNRLMRGHLLIPRISEYAAIFLAHKLRRFDIDIQVGLSDEIHPPKHQEAPETGLVSKHSLYQNQVHSFHFDDPKLDISQIIVAATPGLEGYQVVRYNGVASEHKMVEGHMVQDESSEEIPRFYKELAQKLKAHALKSHSNAVVGLNYQITPLPTEYGTTSSKYRLTCTGNLVWVNKL